MSSLSILDMIHLVKNKTKINGGRDGWMDGWIDG